MTESNRRATIRAYCAARQIDRLVHFTRLENLAGIFAHGLLPRSVLEKRRGQAIFNDGYRADHRKDAVCLSVCFPNYKMLYKLRQADQNATWAVLQIRPDVLWELDCAFCWANAACSTISNLPPAILRAPSSLERMFADRCEVSDISRMQCDILDSYPTNPQAEVLVFSGVPLSQIVAVYFQDDRGRSRFLPPQGIPITVGICTAYFNPRNDWQTWKRATEATSGEPWQDDLSSIPF